MDILKNTDFYQISATSLPVLSAADIASVKPPYVHFRRQYHEYIFYYILDGGLRMREGDADYDLDENDFIVLDPSMAHWGRETTQCRFLYAHFDTGFMNPIRTADNLVVPAHIGDASVAGNLAGSGRESLSIGNKAESMGGRKLAGNKAESTGDEKPAVNRACGLGGLETVENQSDSTSVSRDAENLHRGINGPFLPKHGSITLQADALRCRQEAEGVADDFHSRSTYAAQRAACGLYALFLSLMDGIAHAADAEFMAAQGRMRQALALLAQFLEQSYADDISGAQIEEEFHYNFDYLDRQFKKWKGRTIFQYLNAVRVERARRLLVTGYHSIEEVAAMTGFRDAYYFSKVFKKYSGMTPGQCRGIAITGSQS